MGHGLLSPLQDEVLRVFFDGTRGFVLTGGGALSGFYTRHRTTTDLDLFAFDAVSFAAAVRSLPAMLQRSGLHFTARNSSPEFVRGVVQRGEGTLVVDLVHDVSPQLGQSAHVVDGIALDPLQQIFVNKLTALVGREELRDVVDVMVLQQQGFVVEDNLAAALAKDGGCTPANLAWLLDGWADKIPSGRQVLESYTTDEIVTFMRDLSQRMRRQAMPSG